MPAPPLVIPNCAQIRLIQSIAGQGGVNVLHAQKPAGLAITQAVADTLGAAIKGAWTANMAPHVTAGSGLLTVGVRDLTNANQPEFLDAGSGVLGTAPGDALPGNVALCVTLKTALSGKSFRGRVYLGGWGEAVNDVNGLADSAATAAGVAFITAVGAAMSASGMTLCVASRPAFLSITTKVTTFSDGSTQSEVVGRTNPHPGTSQAVILIQSRNANWESQRRRTNGRGLASLLTPVAQQSISPARTA